MNRSSPNGSRPLRFALFGTGFWARYQLAGWREIGGVECVAFYNRTRPRAEILAREFDVPSVYDNPEELLDREEIDFLDIATDVSTHPQFVAMAAARRLPVICQKPMAPTLHECERMVAACRQAGVPFLIHENWRWQTPIRCLKSLLDAGHIGHPVRATISLVTGFDVFAKQPFLREIEHFILADLGSHLLDVPRFLFGEPSSLYCRTQSVRPDIQGEDVATVVLNFPSTLTVICEMSYAGSHRENDCFPQTMISVEGTQGTIELGANYEIRTTTRKGTQVHSASPPPYQWVDPDYHIVHASIVPALQNLLDGLKGVAPAESTGEDNLKTMRLVFAAYDSAARNEVVHLPREAP